MNRIDASNLQACSCRAASSCQACPQAGVNRREFLAQAGLLAAGGMMYSTLGMAATSRLKEPERQPPVVVPLRLQPVLTYQLPTRHKATSWRSWGGIETEAQLAEEQERIGRELKELAARAGFPMELLPLATAQSVEQAANLAKGRQDGVIVFAAGGDGRIIEALSLADKRNLMFLRHRSGPVYLWYEIAHPAFLRKAVDEFGATGMDLHDVVVDSYEDLMCRLRALHGLKNTLGKRIVAIGGAGGWGRDGQKAPEIARTLWKMDLVNLPYAELGAQIKKARQNEALVARCQAEARNYLKQRGVSLHTTREFVENAFLLTEVFKDAMEAAQTDAITVNSCMGTIMPLAETTACLPLSLLNDAGYLAFCESDFVVIPAGVLLHYISGKPVFLNDPTYPHHGVVTLAHCTAPRKMDGQHYERVKVFTHFESDYGAAPKVEMRIGQPVTNLVPDFNAKRWVGVEGKVVGNPFLAICRSQIEVEIRGSTERLVETMQGFHWMTCYGTYTKEVGYALRKLKVDWLNVSQGAPA